MNRKYCYDYEIDARLDKKTANRLKANYERQGVAQVGNLMISEGAVRVKISYKYYDRRISREVIYDELNNVCPYLDFRGTIYRNEIIVVMPTRESK